RGLRRVPAPGLRNRVVAGLEADLLPAGLPVVLLQNELDRLCHLGRQRAVRALERQVRSDDQLGVAAPLVLNRLARCGRQRRGLAAASAATAASTTCREQGKRDCDQ